MSIIYSLGNREIEITNPERIIFEAAGITKREFVIYYGRIAQYMYPYIENRCITMHRFPEGISKEGFYQKDAPDYFPSWVGRKTVKKKEGGTTRYVVAKDPATMAYLAQNGCVTPHIWLSTVDKLDYPDRMIFDLDPGKQPFSLVQETALKIKQVLEDLGLIPFVMTTGSKGLHVIVPLDRKMNFDGVRDFAQSVTEKLVDQDPDHLTLEMRLDKREGRLFIDTLRNAFGATGVAPYGVRARPGAPVATPLFWREVGKKDLRPDKYTIKNIFARLARIENPWQSIDKSQGSIKEAEKILKKNA